MTTVGSIVLSVLLIGSIIAPFWFILRSVNKKEKKLENGLKQIQEKYSLSFEGNYEIWNEKIIAIDIKRKWLVFLNLSEKCPVEFMANLAETDLVRVQRHTVTENNKAQVRQVDLQLRSSRQVDAWDSVTIFDTTFDDPMDAGFNGELAKKWIAKMESLLDTPRKRRAS